MIIPVLLTLAVVSCISAQDTVETKYAHIWDLYVNIHVPAQWISVPEKPAPDTTMHTRRFYVIQKLVDPKTPRVTWFWKHYPDSSALQQSHPCLYVGGQWYRMRKSTNHKPERIRQSISEILVNQGIQVAGLPELEISEKTRLTFKVPAAGDRQVRGEIHMGRMSSVMVFMVYGAAQADSMTAILNQVSRSIRFDWSYDYPYRQTVSKVLLKVLREQFMKLLAFVLLVIAIVVGIRKKDFILVMFPIIICSIPGAFFIFALVMNLVFR